MRRDDESSGGAPDPASGRLSAAAALMRYPWRIVRTAVGFSLFGIGGLLSGLLIFPLVRLFVRRPRIRRRVARRIIGWQFRAYLAVLTGLGLISWKVTGEPGTRGRSNCLILANHPSLLDVVCLIALFPEADCVVKGSLWRNPFMMLTLKAADYIPNSSPIETLNECINRLRAGRCLILFPEGTRTSPGRRMTLQPGAAAMAVRADSSLLPVLIDCRPTLLAKGDAWYQVPPVPVRFRLDIQAPLDREALCAGARDRRDATRLLNRRLLAYFEEALTGHRRAGGDVSG